MDFRLKTLLLLFSLLPLTALTSIAHNSTNNRSRTGNPMVDRAGLRKIGYLASFAM